MSNPYIYNSTTSSQYPIQYQQTPYYYTPLSSNTPFLPDASLYNSPYSNSASLPGTPYTRSFAIPAISTPNTPNIPFPSSGYDDSYTSAWYEATRQRRPSWHGDSTPFPLQPPNYPVTPIYNRRNSIGNHPNAQFFRVNPWINGEAPRGDFFFDLAPSAFLPLRLFWGGRSAILEYDQLHEPATYPTLTRLRIVCDLIPIWSIDLEFRGYEIAAYQMGTPPPITLSDVLVAIHKSLHRRISSVDWQRLGPAREREVGKAFVWRCKASGNMADHEFAQGVKRVDFLAGRTKMVGLLRGGKVNGWDVMKLIMDRV